MAKDNSLRELFEDFAASSDGALSFRVTTSSELADDVGLQLARSPNPTYVFTLRDTSGEEQTCVAYTLTLDGRGRPATRAEALGRSLAESEGGLFSLNPFLLVFDHTGARLLAVSAIELFDAFAKHAAGTTIPYSGSASFSLTPNFPHGTIYMYADVREPTVWASSTATGDLTAGDLTDFLRRVVQETNAKAEDVPEIVRAIKARLAAAPSESLATKVAKPTAPASEVVLDYARMDPTDESVRVDDRLWQMILAAIASSPAVILVGPPGTGKSALVRKAVAAINAQRQAQGIPGVKSPLWATPDESWTSRELIGGETVDDGVIVFRPGWVLRAIAEDRWLILDEANRGDLDRIFGALLTWLGGGDVAVGVESAATDAKLVQLGWTTGTSRVETLEAVSEDRPGTIRYLASKDEWKLLGTYNALDAQRVFRIGAALGRRFVRVPIPSISPSVFSQVLARVASDLDSGLLNKIGLLYTAHYEAEVTRVGPALFLGMCGYLRSAQTMRTPEPYEASAEDESDASAPADGSDGHPATEDASGASSFADLLVSEAYVLNLGTFLAQLEDPDREQLAHRIQTSEALTRKGVAWVTEMIRALA